MSSDLFVFDNTFFDPFSPSSLHDQDFFQEFSDEFNVNPTTTTLDHQENFIVDESNSSSLDQIATALLSSSPPSHQLESLSLSQTTPLYGDFSAAMDVKTEDSQPQSLYPSFMPQSYGENAMKMMQRSFSSNSFEGRPSNFSPFQPQLDTLLESPNLHAQVLSSPENSSFSSGQMRRVCSTGDLQKMKSRNTLSSSPLSRESSFMEEANFKVGRYSAEERKERIHRYRTKRNQRNFNKTIKYACRKTLADNRPRIRGRFARNDEAGDIPKTANFNRFEDEDDLWIEGVHEEEEEGLVGKGPFFNSYGSTATSAMPTHYQYFSY
nr:zinc finger protein CONSTANS-like [Ipomoea batatas]